MNQLHALFTKEYLVKIDTISLTIKQQLNAGYAGARKSRSKGNSLEFADFRDYTPGDDIRRLDWNSFSRLDKLFIKLFTEEKQATINIILDQSKSMDFGEMNKFLYAKWIAATIAYVALKNADRVNVFCCNQKIEIQKNNVTSKNMFPQLIQFLEDITPSGETMLNDSIKSITKNHLPQGISFIISDFFSKDGFQDAVKLLQNKKQDVVMIQVLAEEEVEPMVHDALRIIDSETNEHEDIMVTADIIKQYKKAFQIFQNEIKDFCQKRGIVYKFAPTDGKILKLFLG